jgi:hypothetical protein
MSDKGFGMIDKDFYDIIAIRFGMRIYFGQQAIDLLKEKMEYDQLISRSEFKMMARMDLGDKWGEYAEHALTLFPLDEKTPFEVRQPNPMVHRMI